MINSLVNHLYPCDNNHKLLIVDLEENYNSFSFKLHYPHKEHEIDHIFRQTITSLGKEVSVSSILQSPKLCDDHLELLQSLNFNQLTNHPKRSIILEHSQLSGWLIKKNYKDQTDENGNLQRNIKVVRGGSDFPSWMLPEELINNSGVNIITPNDCINPLRVVMLKRGRDLINELNLTHIKAAKEYLYLLPDADPIKPLCERTVVISQKENVLSSANSLKRYAGLAHSSPDVLTEIAKQIVLFIKHVKLTDSHLNNFLFLNDDNNVVVAVDGEPIGGLADTSIPEMVTFVQKFDPSFWSLLGLKKLQTSITEQMNAEKIATEDIKRVQAIFDNEINSAIPIIIQERKRELIRLQAHESLLVLNLTYYILKSAINLVHPLSFHSFTSNTH